VRVPRIFLNQPLATDCDVTLDAGNVHYLASVLRMKADMALIAFDG
jgi:16S rRNA U1498 N3-methylase RsmE